MADQAKGFHPSLTIVFITIYAILGPLGLVPAVLGLLAIALARTAPVLRFVLNEYESYHRSSGDSPYQKLKNELSLAVRKDVSAQFETEKSGLKAQIGLINEELRLVRREGESSKAEVQRAAKAIEELRSSELKARQDIDALRTELQDIKKENEKKKENETSAKSPFNFAITSPAPAASTVGSLGVDGASTLKATAPPTTPTFAFGASTPTRPTSPSFVFGLSSPVSAASAAVKSTAPKPKTLEIGSTTTTATSVVPSLGLNSSLQKDVAKPSTPKKADVPEITLPSQLKRLDPTRPGFTCIGRAIASHGGPCGSYSDQYLPQTGRRAAAATLKEMRSSDPSANLFEMSSLRDLASNMLCIRHSRGCKYDQSQSIAQTWYDDLEDTRENLKAWRDEQKFAAVPPSEMMWTKSTSAPWVFSAQPISPASSATSVSVDMDDVENLPKLFS